MVRLKRPYSTSDKAETIKFDHTFHCPGVSTVVFHKAILQTISAYMNNTKIAREILLGYSSYSSVDDQS